MRKIDWQKIWKDFDRWIDSEEEKTRCDECNALGDTPDWERQIEKIQTLVDMQLRGVK